MDKVLRRLKNIEDANARIEARLDELYNLLVEGNEGEKGSVDGLADPEPEPEDEKMDE